MDGITRRQSLALLASLMAAPAGMRLLAEPLDPARSPANQDRRGRWFEKAWRRAVIDMHIPDWDPKFLSEFDPETYFEALERSRSQSIVCYAQSHTGLFNYPTKIGRQHTAWNGRDILGELIDGCHKRGIAVVLYSSLIQDRWACDTHEGWRGKHAKGHDLGENSRFGVVCPNSPYREYVREWVKEICERYEFEGMRFDMTFWARVCYCEHCQRRWAGQGKGPLPRVIDWTDERWVLFQRKREEWLAEFAGLASGTVRKHKPGATVEHQSSTYLWSWVQALSHGMVEQNDFLQGDFYGDAVQGSFARKLLGELSPNRPIGYETSFSVELGNHTGAKSEELLEAKASAAISDAAAFVFIDQIDPIGTLNLKTHERMGRVFDRLMPFYSELGGERVADIAIYYSLDSKFDMREIGRRVEDIGGSDTHTPAATGVARSLLRHHLPFTVITRKNLHELSRFKVVILPNIHHFSATEAAAIRDYVRSGGAIYASGGTSLVDTRGRKHRDFQLAEVFGVSCVQADWKDYHHYIAPSAAGAGEFAEWTSKYPAFVKSHGFKVRAHDTAEVLATTTLIWPTDDPTRFSSAHSDPPWEATDHPEVVSHRYGSGQSVYASSILESAETLTETFIRLIRRLHSPFRVEARGPAAVEVTLFLQPERRRYLLALVNFQRDLPNIPIEGFQVELRVPEAIRRIESLPEKRSIPFRKSDAMTQFIAPRLETLALFAVRYD